MRYAVSYAGKYRNHSQREGFSSRDDAFTDEMFALTFARGVTACTADTVPPAQKALISPR